MDVSSRKMWYFKILSECAREKKSIIITHEYLKKHFDELQQNINERFFEEFEMSHFTIEEAEQIEQYFIPDTIFSNKETESGSRTEFLFSMQEFDEFKAFYREFDKIITEIKNKHPNEKIEACFNCLETNSGLRDICQKYKIPLITYSFSAIRKVHGYQQTLYFANNEALYCTDECEKRFSNFLNENNDFPVLDNKEIIAIFGKTRTLPLIKLINAKPKYELLICRECFSILPHIFNYYRYTDDDIHYKANTIYNKSDIIVRSHAYNLDAAHIDRSEIHNDPASTILSAKRMASVSSQISLKALLWNRTSIMEKNTLPFSFACAKDFKSDETVDKVFLNWFIFCYLIPSGLMFDSSYWLWRLKNKPSEKDIYERHLAFYSLNLGLKKSILTNKSSRFRELLKIRNLDEDFIDELCDNQIPTDFSFEIATSKLTILDYNRQKCTWRLNQTVGDSIKSCFYISKVTNVSKILFYPLDDIAGFAKIRRIEFRDKDKVLKTINDYTDWLFFPKSSGCIDIPLNSDFSMIDFKIEIIWEYKMIKGFCGEHKTIN